MGTGNWEILAGTEFTKFSDKKMLMAMTAFLPLENFVDSVDSVRDIKVATWRAPPCFRDGGGKSWGRLGKVVPTTCESRPDDLGKSCRRPVKVVPTTLTSRADEFYRARNEIY